MTEKCAVFVIKTLEESFGRTFNVEGLKRIKPALMQELDAAMMAAGDIVVTNFSTLPAPAKLLEVVQQEAKRIRMEKAVEREAEAAKEKAEHCQGFKRATVTEYGRRAMLLIRMVQELPHGAPYPNMILEGCLVIANAYPEHAEQWRECRQQFIAYNNSLMPDKEAA